MVIKILIALLVIDFILALILLAGKRSGKEKALWTTVLLAIPLVALAIYQLVSKKDRTASLKDWESK